MAINTPVNFFSKDVMDRQSYFAEQETKQAQSENQPFTAVAHVFEVCTMGKCAAVPA